VVKKGSNAFARTSSLMPVPVSLTDTTAYSPAGKSAGRSTPLSVALLVSIVNVPPRGMASRALMARLSKTSSLIRIDQGRPQSRLCARLKADHGSDRCLQQIAHVCDNVIEVDGFRQKRLFAREREELASEPFAAPDRLSGVAQQLQRAGFLGPALEHLEIAEDCREQIVEVVRDTGRELAYRLHFLGLMQFLHEPSSFPFRPLMGGEILKQFTAPTSFPSLQKRGAILTRTVTREVSGRSMITSMSRAGFPVRRTHSMGVSLCGKKVPSGRNSLCAPQYFSSVSPAEGARPHSSAARRL
jgi:hypothetical protein